MAKFQNFAFIFGCMPGAGVKADTTMCKDVKEAFMHRFNISKLTLEFPGVLDHLVGKDANFEMVASSTIQPLQLTYTNNIIERSRAVVFVSTGVEVGEEPLNYKDAKLKGERVEEMLRKRLKIN